MNIKNYKSRLCSGMIFPKVKVSSRILTLTKDGFTYSIGEKGSCKKVSFVEMDCAITELEKNHFIDRKWFAKTFPKISKSKPCNFTAIGGVLQELGYVVYTNNRYVKLN